MRSLILLFLLFLSACGSTPTPEKTAPSGEASVRDGLNDRFLSPELDVPEFVELFEGESREIAVSRDELAASLRLSPGMHVADVGAGTGLFLESFANEVGKAGRVYAIDISPGFLDHLRERVAEEGLDQVEVVHCTEHSVELGPSSIDLAFICDTYHHFEYPQSTLASIHKALRPGGTLVVVDFERIPGVTRDWVIDHVRAGKDVFRSEIEAAGFVFEGEQSVAGLKENYVLRFRRKD